MKQEFKIIASLIEKNSKILDVGCGNGELMKYILDNISNNIRGLETVSYTHLTLPTIILV